MPVPTHAMTHGPSFKERCQEFFGYEKPDTTQYGSNVVMVLEQIIMTNYRDHKDLATFSLMSIGSKNKLKVNYGVVSPI